MISRIFKARRGKSAISAVPAGERVYAIGDIHGRLDLLESLLVMIERDDATRGPMRTSLVFLGDLIDRGPDAAGVVERLSMLASQRPDTRFIMGNHEEVFLHALAGQEKALRFFCRIGGRETILSYGVTSDAYERLEFPELLAEVGRLVPPHHRSFLAAFEDVIQVGDYIFVHAGIRPGVPIDEQKRSDLRWNRETFLNHRGAFEGIVVHGHTITPKVDLKPNRIGLDTGAFATGKLTALGLQGQDRWLLQT